MASEGILMNFAAKHWSTPKLHDNDGNGPIGAGASFSDGGGFGKGGGDEHLCAESGLGRSKRFSPPTSPTNSFCARITFG